MLSYFLAFKRTRNIKDYIMEQDVVFVGGGNTKSMLAIWNDWGMSDLLNDAYNKGFRDCLVCKPSIGPSGPWIPKKQ